MSADNFNTVIQGPDGKWYAGKNFSMSEWLDKAQATGYWAAFKQVQEQDGHGVFETSEQAAASLEAEDAEYGTSMIEYEDWFGEHTFE